jgi:hypothetical protein
MPRMRDNSNQCTCIRFDGLSRLLCIHLPAISRSTPREGLRFKSKSIKPRLESGILDTMVKRLSLLAIFTSLLLVGGCGGGGASSNTKPHVLFINASADAGALDFRLDDDPQATNLSYAVSNGAFSDIDFHGADVDGWDVSLHLNSNGTEIDREAIIFGQDVDNIIVAHGIKNYGTEQLKRLRFSNFAVNLTRPNGNKAKLYVFHGFELATGNDTPQVTFKTPGDNALFTTSAIDPGSFALLNTDSGSLTFEARRSGTQGIYTTVTKNLKAGGVYLVLISGIENDPTPSNDITIRFIELPSKL